MSVELIDETIQSAFLSSVTDTATLDQSVEEVLGLMLGVPVSVADDTATESNSVTLTAVIGLAGALSGAYTVLVSAEAAMQMTACMAGIEFTTVDDTVIDGLGEITNMLAGAWKSNIDALNSACLLSVHRRHRNPVRGPQAHLCLPPLPHLPLQRIHLHRHYLWRNP